MKTLYNDSGQEYEIDQGAMILTVNPKSYAINIATDKVIISETAATVSMKFILESNFVVATDVFRLLVPPVNKDYESLAGMTPVHYPPHDSAVSKDIVSKLKFTESETGPVIYENDVTNNFDTFDYATWNSREFLFSPIGYVKAAEMAAERDIAKWTDAGPTGGYFDIKLINMMMPPSARPLSYFTVTHERCSESLVAGKCPPSGTYSKIAAHLPFNTGLITPT